MEKLDELYNALYDKGVLVFERSLPFSEATVIEIDGEYGIFLDPSQYDTTSEETVIVAHESGHIFTGTTHKYCDRLKLVDQHENRADKWAIKKLIPVDELDDAVAAGHTDLWDLADHFGVTEQFMKKAVCHYVHGNLAAELYF